MSIVELQLTELHESFVVAVNTAVAADDMALVDRLADEYDTAALALILDSGAPAGP